MKKLTLSVAALTIAMMSYGQSTQCEALTKSNVQCKNVVKTGDLCHLHNPNYVKPSDKCVTVICSGTTKKNEKCKVKTKNCDGLCRFHTKND